MSFAGMNYWAILAAAVAGFLFGGAWYGLLSKQWLASIDKTTEDIQKTGMLVPMLVVLAALIIWPGVSLFLPRLIVPEMLK